MMVIRPIEAKDGEALAELAKITGPGFTSLQDNPAVIEQKMDNALKAFQQTSVDGESLFLFVLEDTQTQVIAGICAIEAAVGLSEPWYNYRIGTLVHA
ncbi:MAG: arginine N-succinyltransferase, partial [Oceanospirillaceae bacterium]